MSKKIEDYLKIIYPDIENLDPETKKKYEKDKAFLEKFLPQYEKMCKRYESRREFYDDKDFFRIVLRMCKEAHDPETKIVDFSSGMLEVLETNDIFCEKFDTLMELMKFGRQEMDKYASVPPDNTPIRLETVYDLTEEFLEKIDPSGKLLAEFKRLKEEGRIEVNEVERKGGSYYSHSEEKIVYDFDGTVNSAHTLVHEFMHHMTSKEAQTNMGYHEFTAFREYLSIYYENAFIQFMDEKGLLPNGIEPLIAARMKSEKEKDPDNCLSMYLELAKRESQRKDIGKEDIIEIARKYFPEIQDDDELWRVASSKLEAFADEHFIGAEVGAGLTMYRFSNALAHASNLDETTLRGMHLLVGKVKDGKHDIEMFNGALKAMGRTEHELIAEMESAGAKQEPRLSVFAIGQRTTECTNIKGKNFITRLFEKWKNRDREQNQGGDIKND